MSNENAAMNAICNSVAMIQAALHQAAYTQTAPHAIYKPRLFQDGNQWCALLGEDLQSGVSGFGESPAKAMEDFDKAWYRVYEPSKPVDVAMQATGMTEAKIATMAANRPCVVPDPVAVVEETVVGPQLFVYGILVKRWLGCVHDAQAKALAEKVNAAASEARAAELISSRPYGEGFWGFKPIDRHSATPLDYKERPNDQR